MSMPEAGRERFGVLPDGQEVARFVLTGTEGRRVELIEWGAAIARILVPDRSGRPGDVVLGFDDLDGYLGDPAYHGVIAGRVANRVAHGRFQLDGREYELSRNDGAHHLHGGFQGLGRRRWQGRVVGPSCVAFTTTSPHGEEGYPGRLEVQVTYTLVRGETLCLDFSASTDAPTPVNLTNHAYFNLAGGGTVLDHVLELQADHYLPVDEGLIPTGAIEAVAGTPFDFRTPTRVGDRLAAVPGGYDHNLVLRGGVTGAPRRIGALRDPARGRVLELSTTEPGLQLYSGNFLDGRPGRGGDRQERHSGLCLETQHFPDSPHHAHFPPVILRPGETWRSRTIFAFPTP